MIQGYFQINFAAVIAHFIEFGNSGIFGAGGNNGSSISTLGMKDGNSGNVGGDGIRGMSHTSKDILPKSIFNACHNESIDNHNHNANASSKPREKSKSGGDGIFGSSGKGTATGVNVRFGNVISLSTCNSEKSKYILGIFVGGI